MKLSILIPTYRGAARLQGLFSSLQAAGIANDPRCEVIALDDGSSHPDYAATARVTWDAHPLRPRLARSDDNRGWTATINALVPLSAGELVLLLDDDALLPQALLPTLTGLFSALGSCGVLSWKSLGTGPGQAPRPRPGFLQPATQLAGYCMAFRRSLWDELGGLDARFRTYCADSDLALRATLAGYPSYRVWWPLVPHEEHGCFAAAPELDRQALAARDLAAFQEKWGAPGAEMEARALARLAEGT